MRTFDPIVNHCCFISTLFVHTVRLTSDSSSVIASHGRVKKELRACIGCCLPPKFYEGMGTERLSREIMANRHSPWLHLEHLKSQVSRVPLGCISMAHCHSVRL